MIATLALATFATITLVSRPLTVSDLLVSINEQCGTQLVATGSIANTIVITAIIERPVEEFKQNFALLLDAEWEGSVLSRPEKIQSVYDARINSRKSAMRNGLTELLNFIKDSTRVEETPDLLRISADKMKEEIPDAFDKLSRLNQEAIDDLKSGKPLWIERDRKAVAVVTFSDSAYGLTVYNLTAKQGQDYVRTYTLTEQPLYNTNYQEEWVRTEGWKLIRELQDRVRSTRGSDILHSAQKVQAALNKPTMAVWYPTDKPPRTGSITYKVYKEQGNWILMRPSSFELPNFYAIDALVPDDGRMLDPIQALTFVAQSMINRPYRYMDSGIRGGEPNRLFVNYWYREKSEFWQSLNSDEKLAATKTGLPLTELNPVSRSLAERVIVRMLSKLMSEERTIADQLTPHDIERAVIKILPDVEQTYSYSTSVGTYYSPSWEGLSGLPNGWMPTEDSVMEVCDRLRVNVQIQLPEKRSIEENSYIYWRLGYANFSDLKNSDPDDHIKLLHKYAQR